MGHWLKHHWLLSAVLIGVVGCGPVTEDTPTEEPDPTPTAGSPSTAVYASFATTSAECPAGGVEIHTGIDEDGDGELDVPGEVDATQWVCNGTDGADGATGPAGADGADGSNSLIAVSASTACTSGGWLVSVGVDDDGDGSLASGEVDDAVDVCNGDSGDGSSTTNGLPVVKSMVGETRTWMQQVEALGGPTQVFADEVDTVTAVTGVAGGAVGDATSLVLAAIREVTADYATDGTYEIATILSTALYDTTGYTISGSVVRSGNVLTVTGASITDTVNSVTTTVSLEATEPASVSGTSFTVTIANLTASDTNGYASLSAPSGTATVQYDSEITDLRSQAADDTLPPPAYATLDLPSASMVQNSGSDTVSYSGSVSMAMRLNAATDSFGDTYYTLNPESAALDGTFTHGAESFTAGFDFNMTNAASFVTPEYLAEKEMELTFTSSGTGTAVGDSVNLAVGGLGDIDSILWEVTYFDSASNNMCVSRTVTWVDGDVTGGGGCSYATDLADYLSANGWGMEIDVQLESTHLFVSRWLQFDWWSADTVNGTVTAWLDTPSAPDCGDYGCYEREIDEDATTYRAFSFSLSLNAQLVDEYGNALPAADFVFSYDRSNYAFHDLALAIDYGNGSLNIGSTIYNPGFMEGYFDRVFSVYSRNDAPTLWPTDVSPITTARTTFTNEAGVVLTIQPKQNWEGNIVGDLKYEGVSYGTINASPVGYVVRYSDGVFETLAY